VQEKVKDSQKQILAALGAEIRRRREGQGLTPRDLAAKAGVPYNSLCRFEAGADIRLRPFHRLCQALGVRMSDVVASAHQAASRRLFSED
jgi:transcriptional regulator with XRE-family HTH domain